MFVVVKEIIGKIGEISIKFVDEMIVLRQCKFSDFVW